MIEPRPAPVNGIGGHDRTGSLAWGRSPVRIRIAGEREPARIGVSTGERQQTGIGNAETTDNTRQTYFPKGDDEGECQGYGEEQNEKHIANHSGEYGRRSMKRKGL
jgi:hypothetical protein